MHNICYNFMRDDLVIHPASNPTDCPPFCFVLRSLDCEGAAHQLINDQQQALMQEAEAILHEKAKQMMYGKSAI